VSQSFPSVFPLLSGGTMATSKGCCHLTGAMLNLAAEAADRARIQVDKYTNEPRIICHGVKIFDLILI
jgi:hypothetical protein